MLQRLTWTSRANGKSSALVTTTVSTGCCAPRWMRVMLRLNCAADAMPATTVNAIPMATRAAKAARGPLLIERMGVLPKRPALRPGTGSERHGVGDGVGVVAVRHVLAGRDLAVGRERLLGVVRRGRHDGVIGAGGRRQGATPRLREARILVDAVAQAVGAVGHLAGRGGARRTGGLVRR